MDRDAEEFPGDIQLETGCQRASDDESGRPLFEREYWCVDAAYKDDFGNLLCK